MNNQELLEFQWPYLLSLLPKHALEHGAFESGAIRRRREVADPTSLLRLILAYGFCQMSLREVAAWAEVARVASLSNVALLKRLRASGDWLSVLVGAKLAERAALSSVPVTNRPVRLVDATCLSKPGSTGTDWRLHVCYEPGTLRLSQVQLTDAKGGETLTRFACQANDLFIADRGYAHRSGLAHVLRQNADFIVRLNWQNLPLLTPEGAPFELLPALRTLPEASPHAFSVQVSPTKDTGILPPVRLVALRKTEVAAEAARARLIRERSKKGRTVDPRTLEAAGYFFVLTSLQTLTSERILELYRFRWQIELAFKRLKSLLEFDELPAKEPGLARTFILAKILGALLLEDLTTRYLEFSPWGYPLE